MKLTRDKALETKKDMEKYINKNYTNTKGLKYKIVGVHDKIGRNKRYIVIFKESGFECLTYRSAIINRTVQDLSIPHREIGNIYTTKNCGDFKIEDIYTDEKGLRRVDGFFINTKSRNSFLIENLKRGEAYDVYAKTIHGIGYWGNIDIRRYDKLYIKWFDMIERCYTDRFNQYEKTLVDTRWHSFENFAKDAEDMESYKWLKEFNTVRFDIDKDILGDGKLYSKETCLFIPHDVNMLFAFKHCTNTSGFPGVSYSKEKGKYQIGISREGKRVPLGYCDNPVEGYHLFMKHKLVYCDEVLKRYDFIDNKLKTNIKRILKRKLLEVLNV